jgi:hypothetical protein
VLKYEPSSRLLSCPHWLSLTYARPQGFKSSIQPPLSLRTSRTRGLTDVKDLRISGTSRLQAFKLQAFKPSKASNFLPRLCKTLLPFVGWFQGFKSLLRSSTQRQAPVFDSRLTTALSPSFTFAHVPGLSRPFMVSGSVSIASFLKWFQGVVHIGEDSKAGCRCTMFCLFFCA